MAPSTTTSWILLRSMLFALRKPGNMVTEAPEAERPIVRPSRSWGFLMPDASR